MEAVAKKSFPAWLILCIIALVAGGLLGLTNYLTKEPIAEQIASVAESARASVLPSAESFNELTAGDKVDYCFEGVAGGEVTGHVCQVTVKGYGGEIEVTVGMDKDGVITGVAVGGAKFSETAGLGAKTKDAAFTGQYVGLSGSGELAVDKDGGEVDSVTGATRSSRAVTDAVNTACIYMAGLN